MPKELKKTNPKRLQPPCMSCGEESAEHCHRCGRRLCDECLETHYTDAYFGTDIALAPVTCGV